MTDRSKTIARDLIIGLLFGLIGFGLNWLKLELFFNVDFLFGSIVTMVDLQRFADRRSHRCPGGFDRHPVSLASS